MSGDHNMNQTDSAWRKRQIALNKKAENARELGLDYEPNKTIREMAYEAGFAGTASVFYMKALERFADLVRADERNRTWTQEHWTEYERSIAAAERERLAKVFDERDKDIGWYDPGEPAEIIRGQA